MFVPVDFSTEIVVIITHYYEMIKIKIFDRALSELALQSSLKKHLKKSIFSPFVGFREKIAV